MYRKILIANDGSEGAAQALRAAIALARVLRAELHMVSVEESAAPPDHDRRGGRGEAGGESSGSTR